MLSSTLATTHQMAVVFSWYDVCQKQSVLNKIISTGKHSESQGNQHQQVVACTPNTKQISIGTKFSRQKVFSIKLDKFQGSQVLRYDYSDLVLTPAQAFFVPRTNRFHN